LVVEEDGLAALGLNKDDASSSVMASAQSELQRLGMETALSWWSCAGVGAPAAGILAKTTVMIGSRVGGERGEGRQWWHLAESSARAAMA